MKNKKIVFIILILFFILVLNSSNSFAITHVTTYDHNNGRVFLSLRDTLDRYKYIVVIEQFRDYDNSQFFTVYWSDEPFSISVPNGTSYFFYSESGAKHYSYENLDNQTVEYLTTLDETQHTATFLNDYEFQVIFSTFDILDKEGNVIIPKGEYGVDFSNTNNSSDFYEGNENTTITEPVTDSINTGETEDFINNSISDITNKFSFYKDIQKNVSDMIDVIVNTGSSPKLTLNINSKWFSGDVTIIDMSFYEPYKEIGDNIICLFVYVGFLWNIFIRLPDIIKGAGASSYINLQVGDINAYRKTGFGRSSNIKRRGF